MKGESMKKFALVSILFLVAIAGCAYNSRNILDLQGHDMGFSYGLISVQHVDRVIILRETNAGEGEAKNNLVDISKYMCFSWEKPAVEDAVKVEIPAEMPQEAEQPK